MLLTGSHFGGILLENFYWIIFQNIPNFRFKQSIVYLVGMVCHQKTRPQLDAAPTYLTKRPIGDPITCSTTRPGPSKYDMESSSQHSLPHQLAWCHFQNTYWGLAHHLIWRLLYHMTQSLLTTMLKGLNGVVILWLNLETNGDDDTRICTFVKPIFAYEVKLCHRTTTSFKSLYIWRS